MGLSEFTPIAVLGLMAYVGQTVTNYVLDLLGLKAKKAGPIVTLLLVYVWSFGMLLLLSVTRWAGEVRVGDGDNTLEGLTVPELLVVAFFVMAVAVGIDKLVKARDMTQSAATPSLTAPKNVGDEGQPDVPVGAPTPPANLADYFDPDKPNPNEP